LVRERKKELAVGVSAYDIEERLRAAHGKLCDTFPGEVTYDAISATIDDAICQPPADGELSDLHITSILGAAPERFVALSILACYYQALSAELARQGKLPESKQALNRALGKCTELEEYASAQFDLHSYSGVAQAGGVAKARKFDPIKDRIIELMSEKCPEGGWKSKAAVVRAIEQDVLDASAGLLSANNIDRTLTKWLSQDARLVEHFDTVKSPRKSTR